METTHGLRPRAAACLNVSADHLDRHRTLERYAALKERLLTAAEHAIVNIDDPLAAAMGARHPHAIAVSIERPLPTGFSIVRQRGERWLGQDGRPLIAASRIALAGRHNEANALAALALVSTLVDDLAPAVAVLEEFAGLPHRCQRVALRGGVTFVNDSKGTNVGATLAALQGLAGPLVLIAGGLAKGQDLSPLALAALGKVKAAVLIGTAAAELEQLLNPVCETRRADSIEAAVRTATELARPGDTVLLSPACASQDMFRDYRERGERFARAAEGLPA
jgi:UDP-N-acetylmuramoylalanine--D-glutamate ligase